MTETVVDSTVRRASGLRVAGFAIVLGFGWGAVTSLLQTVLPRPFAGLANAVAPWVMTPVVVGALARNRRQAMLAGAVACLLQVAGYYVLTSARGFGVSPSYVLFWSATALVGGPVFGLAGQLWRNPGEGRLRGLGPALVAGVWASEALASYVISLRYYGDAVVFGVIAIVLGVVLGRRPGPLLAAARWFAVVLLAGVLAYVGMNPLLRLLMAGGSG